jgi:hypothetical protein
VSLLTPADAKGRVAAAAHYHPERLPGAYRDLHAANILKHLRAQVDRAIQAGASPPTLELIAAFTAELDRWGAAQ